MCDASPPVDPAATDGRTVVLERTGGFAGVNDRVEVREDGSYTAATRTEAYSGVLDDSETDVLWTTVERLDGESGPATYRGDARDDYEYRLILPSRTIHGHSTALPDHVSPLVRQLERLLWR